MSTFTEHYSLIKPGEGDLYDITDWNENMDAIDGQMAAQEEAAAEISGKIGTPAAEGETLFSLLREGGGEGMRGIKSIQHVVYAATARTETSKAIKKVDPTKCIVIFERLFDFTERSCAQVSYQLQAEKIEFSVAAYSGGSVTVGFWIVEFC